MKRVKTILWGLVFIAAGVLYAVDVMVPDANFLFDGWWTLIIIVPSLISLIADRNKTLGFIGVCVGTVLLLCKLGVLDINTVSALIVPAIIVFIGLKMIFGSLRSNKAEKLIDTAVTNGAHIHHARAVFGSQNLYYSGEEFNGAKLTSVFGGITCDLRGASFSGDSVIKVSSVFGGIDIIVPDHVNVKVNSNSLFGGIKDRRHRNSNSNQYTVYVDGNCLFGGVDIK